MPTISFQQKVAKRLMALTLLLLAATVFSALTAQHWFLELFSHFTPHYFVLAFLCLPAFAVLRAWRWAALACALALWNGYPVARALLQHGAPATNPSPARHFTLFHFNVSMDHERPARITSYLLRRAKEIDVVVFLEASDKFASALDDLKSAFPHQIRYLEDSPFGIAMISKHPFETGVISSEPSRLYPHIEATVKLPGRHAPLALFAVHAPPPISGEMADDRNRKFDYIARRAAALAHATPVVAGDFNLTPWSPYFEKFLTDSALKDARTPRRFEHTWPVTFNNAHIGLAIDHTFAHPALPLIKRAIGPDLGSDHLPVTATFEY
jgi:endonuclease/exonuclease/phosphatase (EEP) superfamily protein YafD